MVIHKCVSTTTCPKTSFWSFFGRFWTSSIHVDERLVSTPCLFSHFHPFVTFRPPKLEKCQNWVQNGALNRTKCHQNAIQNTCILQSCFLFVFCSKMSPKMEPKMALETPFFHSFFTCGPKPRLWSHFCPLLAHFGCPEAPFWPHFGPFLGPPKLQFWYPRPLF